MIREKIGSSGHKFPVFSLKIVKISVLRTKLVKMLGFSVLRSKEIAPVMSIVQL